MQQDVDEEEDEKLLLLAEATTTIIWTSIFQFVYNLDI